MREQTGKGMCTAHTKLEGVGVFGGRGQTDSAAGKSRSKSVKVRCENKLNRQGGGARKEGNAPKHGSRENHWPRCHI